VNSIYNEYINTWIDKITTPVEGYKICPFASSARYVIEKGTKSDLYKAIQADISKLDLAVFIYEDYITVQEAKELEEETNNISEHIVMLDHPQDPGFIGDLNTGNGRYVIYLIQNKNSLLAARKTLLKTSYYDNWSTEYYERVVIASEK
jgi:hypothetical protein